MQNNAKYCKKIRIKNEVVEIKSAKYLKTKEE